MKILSTLAALALFAGAAQAEWRTEVHFDGVVCTSEEAATQQYVLRDRNKTAIAQNCLEDATFDRKDVVVISRSEFDGMMFKMNKIVIGGKRYYYVSAELPPPIYR